MKAGDVKDNIKRRQRYRMIASAVVFFVAIAAGLMDYIGVFVMLVILGLFLMHSYLFYNAETPNLARMYNIGRNVFGFLFILYVVATVAFFLLNYWGGR